MKSLTEAQLREMLEEAYLLGAEDEFEKSIDLAKVRKDKEEKFQQMIDEV